MAWINWGLDQRLMLPMVRGILLHPAKPMAWINYGLDKGHWLRGTSQAGMRLHASRFAEMLGMGREASAPLTQPEPPKAPAIAKAPARVTVRVPTAASALRQVPVLSQGTGDRGQFNNSLLNNDQFNN